jgi:hypothetical protein
MTRDKAAGTITSRDAIAALLEKYAEHMPGEVTVPSQPGSAHQLCSNSSADATLNSSLVGSLQHLANSTRPDIAYMVGVLGRYSKQGQPHWDAALRVLRYRTQSWHHIWGTKVCRCM